MRYEAFRATLIAQTDESQGFSYIVSLDSDMRGHVFVADALQLHVTEFTATGDFIRSLGRRGQGPGEFGGIASVQIGPGDTLFVYDPVMVRLSAFPPNMDRVAYTVPLPASPGGFPTSVWRVDHDSLIIAAYAPAFSTGSESRAAGREESVWLMKVDGSRVRDSALMRLPAASMLYYHDGGRLTVASNPFGARPLLALSADDKLYAAMSDVSTVAIRSLGARELGQCSVPMRPSSVTAEDIAAAAENVSPQLQGILRDSAPAAWPRLSALVVDDSGRAWMGLVGEGGHTTEWAVCSPGKGYVGSLMLPSSVSIYSVRGDRAIGVATDADGVPRVVIYRIGAIASGGVR